MVNDLEKTRRARFLGQAFQHCGARSYHRAEETSRFILFMGAVGPAGERRRMKHNTGAFDVIMADHTRHDAADTL
jgi:hypothetical protein